MGATSGYRSDGGGAAATDLGDDGDGLVKVGCRYYDADTGRFTTRDTDLSQKAYVYCEADPVNYVDPSGHWSWTVVGIGIITAIIGILPDGPATLFYTGTFQDIGLPILKRINNMADGNTPLMY